jgi:hypothetical protein
VEAGATVFRLRCPPTPVWLIEDVGVFFPFEGGLGALVLLQIVQVLEEEQRGGLLGVVELGGAAGLFPEDVIDVFNACSNTGTQSPRGETWALHPQ